jgi:sulfur-oxidizing protein SoxX
MRRGVAVATATLIGLAPITGAAELAPYRVDGFEIAPLENTMPGNPVRGRQIVRDINNATCLICHAMPIPEEPDHGEIGPSLHGVGSRYTTGELRLRLIDPKVINAETIMPSYYRVEGLSRVSEAFQGRPIYDAQQIEDVVAYLVTLTEEKN